MVFEIIRIAAVVGLSVIKVASTVLKIKEAKQQGLINPVFANSNSTPYQQPVYQQPVNVNNTYPVQTQPVWTESRRYATTPAYQQPVNPMPQMMPINRTPVQPQVLSWNVTNNYSRQFNDPTSRRNMNMTQPIWQNQSWNNNVNNYNANNYYNANVGAQNVYQPMKRLEPNWVSYRPNMQNIPMQSYSMNNTNMNLQYPYGTSSNHYDTLDGWVGSRTCTQQNQVCPNMNIQALNWREVERNNSMNNTCFQVNKNPPHASPSFNWDAPHLKWTPPWENSDGVVAMFGAPDGTPLYGSIAMA